MAPSSAGHEDNLRRLMTAGLQGDEKCYREFLAVLAPLLRSFFRRRLATRDSGTAEDLVQETLLAVHLRRQGYDSGRPITAWLFAIARYKLIDHLRRAQNATSDIPLDAVDDLFASETADASEPTHDLGSLMSHLPEKQRNAITLVKLEGFTAREASARIGVSEADVKISIHRGLKKLMALAARAASQ